MKLYEQKGAMMDTIQREYKKRIDAMTPKERMARAASMFQWARDIIARQITSNDGPVSSERLKWLIAMRQYGADSMMRQLIRKALDNVPS